MDGLERILKLRGGLRGLSSCVTFFVFWCLYPLSLSVLTVRLMKLTFERMDVLGSAVDDTSPRFSIPHDVTNITAPSSSNSPWLQSLLRRLRSYSCPELDDTATALDRGGQIANVINYKASDLKFWRDGINGTRLIGIHSHCLLSLSRMPDPENSTNISPPVLLRESTRLALLIVLAKLKLVFALVADEIETLEHGLATILSVPTTRHPLDTEIKLWISRSFEPLDSLCKLYQSPTQSIF